MLESNSFIKDEELLITYCNDLIKENNKIEKKTTSTDICIKIIDYLMF